MFVQLQLAGPEGRMVDPSKIPIIDPSERSPTMKTWSAEQFMSQVIVEFCNERNSITSDVTEKPTEKNDVRLYVSPLDEEGGENQEEAPATTSTAELGQNQQSEIGPSTILEQERGDKEESVNESDLRNKDIESIPEAPELESQLLQRTKRHRNKKKEDIIGSPTSVAQHLTLLDNNNNNNNNDKSTVDSPANGTPRSKRPHLSRRSSLRQEQAPMSVPSRQRPSLLNKLEKISSRRSVVPSAAVEETSEQAPMSAPSHQRPSLLSKLEKIASRRSVVPSAVVKETSEQAPMSAPSRTRPSLLNKLDKKISSRRSVVPSELEETMAEIKEEDSDSVPPTPSSTRQRRFAVFGAGEGTARSLRGALSTPGSKSTSMHNSRRKVISKTAADRLGSSLPLIRSIFDDEKVS